MSMANMSNGFPGFPFGFPAQGVAGQEPWSPAAGKTFLSAGMMDSGFMAGGNIDFIKMAALVRMASVVHMSIIVSYIIRPQKCKSHVSRGL